MPTLPTLSITDNEDGTATFAVSAGDVGSVNTIKYAKTSDLLWIDLTTINGNASSAAIAMETGAHWFCCSAASGGNANVTSPVMVAITSNPLSVYDRILLATVNELKSIATAGSLTGLDATKVVRQDAVFVSNLTCSLPAIVVTPGQTETTEGGTNVRDDWVYPVEVLIVDTKWKKDASDTSTYLLWRERIRRHFNFSRLAIIRSNVPEVYINQVTPKDILAYDLPEKGLARFSSMLTIQFKTREARGA